MTISAHNSTLRIRWMLAITLIIFAGLAIPLQLHADDLLKPNRDQKRVAKLIASIMADEHLSKLPLDDEMSKRAFDTFIKTLDPTKAYFLKSDIDEFEAQKNYLDNMLRQGDFTFAIEVYNRFLERVDQRAALAIELVDAEYDFTLDEEMVTDPDLIEFPANDAEAHEAWRKRIKYNLLVMKDDGTEDEKPTVDGTDNETDPKVEPKKKKKKEDPKVRLRKRFSSFAKRMHQTDVEDIVEMYITAVTSS